MTDHEYCEECGRKLEFKIEGSIQGLFCEKCGWNVVTTYIPSIKIDPTIYQVFLIKNPPPTIKQIKAVSQICNHNYLQVRSMFLETQVLLYEGDASSTLTAIKTLEEECVLYKVVPQFPHHLG